MREKNRASQTIQNTLRRILEHYFRILGGISYDGILDKFDGEDKIICKSLLSWVNEGSHSVPDDIYMALDTGTTAKYLEIFRQVFVKLGQENHYNMMGNTHVAISAVVQ